MVSYLPKKEIGMAKKYVVTLAIEERELLKAMIGSGIDRARTVVMMQLGR